MTNDRLLWKFKGSNVSFCILDSLRLPAEVKVARTKLKELFGMSTVTSIDFVLYLDALPNVVLSDLYMLPIGAKVQARRCSHAEAEKLISAANQSHVDSTKANETVKNESDAEKEYVQNGLKNVEPETAISESYEDDEDAKIHGAMMENNDYYHDKVERESLSRRYYRTRVTPEVKVHADANVVKKDYVCHICGECGHHIRNCSHSTVNRLRKKVRSALGIPTDFLISIPTEDIDKYDEVFAMSDGSYAIMRDISTVSAEAYFTKSVDQRVRENLGLDQNDSSNISQGFICPVCNCIFDNPVTVLCCGTCFCFTCATGNSESATKEIQCPACKKQISSSQLQTNNSLKLAVDALILQKGPNVGKRVVIKKDAKPESLENKNNDTAQTIKTEPKRTLRDHSGTCNKALKRQKNLASGYIASFLTAKRSNS
ncbi:bifunctional Zinc finger [Babesia duncani]|uniref:Bifunctional Zinc finger n=1 Tax=Babesia duncani TaxID=323732 RepID=A0AAD9PKX6_9APIC|nr:bifunctional Zinc finger [Babesia duncani]